MEGSASFKSAVDLLLVSPMTTAGWRRGDIELLRALRELGVEVKSCTSDFRLARHFRRTTLLTDLAEAAAIRHATTRALEACEPRAIIYSSPQATMLQPSARLDGATALRFDVPAAFNRTGPGSWLLHALERRALRHMRLLLPIGVKASDEAAAVAGTKRLVALPTPIEAPGGEGKAREPIAIAYAGNPEKKGLDLVASAWGRDPPSGWRLLVTGIHAAAGRRFLAERGVDEPPKIDWPGVLEAARYRDLLTSATVFLSASRYEDHGLAQLEALAFGTLLVTTPSDGPYEALHVARELDPRLVAKDASADALARALHAAVSMSEEERLSYRRRARAHVAPYSRETLRQRLRDEVLPALLG